MNPTVGTLAFVFVVAVANLVLGYAAGVVARRGALPRIPLPKWRRPPQPPPPEVEVSFDTDSPPEFAAEPAADFFAPLESKRADTFAESLAKVLEHLSAYTSAMLEFADRLRLTLAAPNVEAIQHHGGELHKLSQDYLEQLNGSMRLLKRRKPPAPDAEHAQRLRNLLDDSWQVINETMINLVGFQCTDETLPESSVRLESAAEKLLLATFQARDALESQFAVLVREGFVALDDVTPSSPPEPLESPEPTADEPTADEPTADEPTADKLTEPKPLPPCGVLGRLNWDVELATVRQSAEPESPPPCAALLDLDEAARWPREIGWAATERLFVAVEKVIGGVLGEGVSVFRLRGQQWSFWLPSCVAEAAAERVEQVRQALEKARFQIGERELNVTVSGTVLPVANELDADGILESLRQALREGKSAGRNRTFLGTDSPRPVVPPALEMEPQVVAV